MAVLQQVIIECSQNSLCDIYTKKQDHWRYISLYVNDTAIHRVYVTKFLGVQIDSELSWKDHIDYICKKNYQNVLRS